MFTQPPHPGSFSYCLLLDIDQSGAKSFNTTTITRCIQQFSLKEAIKRERDTKDLDPKPGLLTHETPLFLLCAYKLSSISSEREKCL